jgi:uncharacterized protein YoxC
MKTNEPIEIGALVVGVGAIVASGYFIFASDDNASDIANKVISLAFLVFVVYNFLVGRSMKEDIQNLAKQNEDLSSDLQEASDKLEQAQYDVNDLKDDLLKTQKILAEKEKEIEELNTQEDEEA